MSQQIEAIKKEIAQQRVAVLNHPVYEQIKDIEDLRIFMQHHIYAVWDFMSLLKSLQNKLTCTAIPWIPFGSAETRYFINEIVVGEECDVDQFGKRMSHFELYLKAMREIGADTDEMTSFLEQIKHLKSLHASFESLNIPQSIQKFVNYTFDIIENAPVHVQAAVFTFGREDLIPDMFHSMIDEIYRNNPDKMDTFKYYLERHIEVDGDHHSLLAIQMLEDLCGDDTKKWSEVKNAAIESLEKRAELWDGVLEEVRLQV